MTAVHRRRQATLAGVALLVLLLIVILARGCGSSSSAVRPFHYSSKHEHTLAARAAEGVAHGLYVNSPGGAVATAARVAGWRKDVERAAKAGDVDPDALEGIVFLESGGDPEAMAGGDPSAATGLTQILPDTATSLLKMHVDLAESKRLTAAIAKAARRGQDAKVVSLKAHRARIDDRFVPAKELAGTVRYLVYARKHVHRDDLALASYHMGIGNLQSVLAA
ncbi:MAG TPA: transglycosylase SLT domain-containing protein, partial [Solirubrobacteraceae bacterium]